MGESVFYSLKIGDRKDEDALYQTDIEQGAAQLPSKPGMIWAGHRLTVAVPDQYEPARLEYHVRDFTLIMGGIPVPQH